MFTMIRSAIGAQYGASLAMFRGCVERADAAVWQAAVGKFPFWHVAYHALFYTDLYLSPNEESFRPQSFHREGYQHLGPNSWAPDPIVVDRPYDRETISAYVDACRAKAKSALAAETEATLAGPSGYSWLEFTRFELHLYNLRHIQHHTGQLGAALRRQHGDGVSWLRSQAL